MIPAQIREARQTLGLTLSEFGRLLEVRRRDASRYEAPVTASSHRRLPLRAGRLIEAYLAGYRPSDWPSDKTVRQREKLLGGFGGLPADPTHLMGGNEVSDNKERRTRQ